MTPQNVHCKLQLEVIAKSPDDKLRCWYTGVFAKHAVDQHRNCSYIEAAGFTIEQLGVPNTFAMGTANKYSAHTDGVLNLSHIVFLNQPSQN